MPAECVQRLRDWSAEACVFKFKFLQLRRMKVHTVMKDMVEEDL